jgi:DNA-binding Xre family transcriptional regulator
MDKLESINKWLAAEVNDRMEDMELRPHHLQRLCGMTDGEIDRCLAGTGFPKLFSLILMAERLECTVNDLLGYEEVEDVNIYERYTASTLYFKDNQYAACLSDRMRLYMKYNNISFHEIADKTGFNVENVRHWFAKTHAQLPPTKKFITICEALGCTPTELLGY